MSRGDDEGGSKGNSKESCEGKESMKWDSGTSVVRYFVGGWNFSGGVGGRVAWIVVDSGSDGQQYMPIQPSPAHLLGRVG